MIMSTGSIEASPSPSPGSFPTTITLHNSFPKMGTLIPNRVFVGGISTSTTESELHQLFSEFGNVKQTKIIADRSGVSKGYGFVTFETEEEARRLQAASEDIVLKERKLNIAPAIKKQPNYTTGAGRGYEMGQPIVNGAVYYHNGIPYTYQNGVAMFIGGDPNTLNGLLSPTGHKGGLPSSPYSVLYPGAGSTTMFIPTPAQAGPSTPLLQHTTAHSAATAQQQQQQSTAAAAAQQLHLQSAAAASASASAAAIRDLAQSPVGCGGSGVQQSKQTPSNQAWRYASSTPGTPAGTPTATPHHLNQTISIPAQDCVTTTTTINNNMTPTTTANNNNNNPPSNSNYKMTPTAAINPDNSQNKPANSIDSNNKPGFKTTTTTTASDDSNNNSTSQKQVEKFRKVASQQPNIFQFPPAGSAIQYVPASGLYHGGQHTNLIPQIINPNQQHAGGNPVPFITAPTVPLTRVSTVPPARGSGSATQEPAGSMKVSQTNPQPSIVYDHIQQEKQFTKLQVDVDGHLAQQQQQQHPQQLYQHNFQDEAYSGQQLLIPYSQQQPIPVFKPGVHFGNQLPANIQVIQQGGQTIYHQMPAASYGSYVQGAGQPCYQLPPGPQQGTMMPGGPQQGTMMPAASQQASMVPAGQQPGTMLPPGSQTGTIMHPGTQAGYTAPTIVPQSVEGGYGLNQGGGVYQQMQEYYPQYYHPQGGSYYIAPTGHGYPSMQPGAPGLLPAGMNQQPPPALPGVNHHQVHKVGAGSGADQHQQADGAYTSFQTSGGDTQAIWKPDYNTAQTIWQPDATWQPNSNNNTGIWQPPVAMASKQQQQWRAPVNKNKTIGKDSETKIFKDSSVKMSVKPDLTYMPNIPTNYYAPPPFNYPHNSMCPQQMGSLPPLTPITPSVEPGQGSKTGFAVPHTPNTMTNSQFQFSNCVQSPAPSDSDARSSSVQSNNDYPLIRGGEKGASKLSSTNPEVIAVGQEREHLNSPFKQFVKFTGLPNRNRFPLMMSMPRLGKRNMIFPLNQVPPRHQTAGKRTFGGQNLPRGNLSSSFDNRFRQRRPSESKGVFYKKGDGFGKRNESPSLSNKTTEIQASPPPVFLEKKMLSPILKEVKTAGSILVKTAVKSVDLPQTPPPTPAIKQLPAVKMLAEPDLLQGKMKKLDIHED